MKFCFKKLGDRYAKTPRNNDGDQNQTSPCKWKWFTIIGKYRAVWRIRTIEKNNKEGDHNFHFLENKRTQEIEEILINLPIMRKSIEI